MKPEVSIITPMFNSEKFISETIKSVISQTYKDWELLLIDDFSKDSTVSIVQAFIDKTPQIKIIKNKTNQGAAVSRNKGIEMAKGDYIAFLDADDLWKPQKLEKQIAFMKSNNCEVSYTGYEQIDESGNLLYKQVNALDLLTYKKCLKSNYIGNLTGVYCVKALGKIMSPNLKKRQDWLLWLKAIKASKKPAMGIQESLAYYRIRDNSLSSKKIELLKHNYLVFKKGLGFSTLKSLFAMLVFLKEHFFIKSKQTVSINKI